MALSLRHTGIVVRDLDAALRFYGDLLGFSVARRMDESGAYLDNMLGLRDVRVTTVKMTAPGGGMIELLHFAQPAEPSGRPAEPNAPGFTHVALTVPDLDEAYGRMCDHGVAFNAPPQMSPDGAAKVTFCRDPEGNLLELVEVMAA